MGEPFAHQWISTPMYYSIYQKKSDCILSLNCTRDYEEGLKMAREQNKPLLIDLPAMPV
jgi:hypothetical protein